MANTNEIKLDLSGGRRSLAGLEKSAKAVAGALRGAFSDGAAGAKKAGQSLDTQITVLRMHFGKLKAALSELAAPLLQSVTPAIYAAMSALTRFAKGGAAVLSELLGFDSTSAENMDSLAKSTSSAGKAAKKALASFDEIERLSFSGGSSKSADTPDVTTGNVKDKLTPQLRKIVDKIRSLLAPLQKIDLTPLTESFEKLKAAVSPITAELFSGLEWAWRSILVPLAKWTIEDALPVFLGTVTALLQLLGAVIQGVKPALTWLWEHFLVPAASWAGETLLTALDWLRQRLEAIGSWISGNQGLVTGLSAAANALSAAWNGSSSALDGFVGRTGGVSAALAAQSTGLGGLVTALGALKTAWGAVSEFVQSRGLEPMGAGIEGLVNGAIGALNGLISGLQKAVNAMVGALNNLRFTVPDWVPGLGGESVGFQLKTVSFPQIPYLAKGAVLPANKPFLAVVGDQRHGTNIEAPLETIQQAVAAVVSGGNAALAGRMDESVALQREILRTILGIEIGDTTIGRAAARYNEKMTVMGGQYA